jgi:hypothetical protein
LLKLLLLIPQWIKGADDGAFVDGLLLIISHGQNEKSETKELILLE